MKKALTLLLLLPFAALLQGCGDDAAPAEASKPECQIIGTIVRQAGFQDAGSDYIYKNNNLITLTGWYNKNFIYAGDSIINDVPASKYREIAFVENGKIVRHNTILNYGTGTHTEIRKNGKLTYSGDRLTKITYDNAEYKFTGNNNIPVIVPGIKSEISYSYDGSGSVDKAEFTRFPSDGSVASPYKTVIVTYSDKAMNSSGNVAYPILRYHLCHSDLIGFYTQLKMYNKVPVNMTYTDVSLNPPIGAVNFAFTSTLDNEGNVSTIEQISGTRILNFSFTYKCP